VTSDQDAAAKAATGLKLTSNRRAFKSEFRLGTVKNSYHFLSDYKPNVKPAIIPYRPKYWKMQIPGDIEKWQALRNYFYVFIDSAFFKLRDSPIINIKLLTNTANLLKRRKAAHQTSFVKPRERQPGLYIVFCHRL